MRIRATFATFSDSDEVEFELIHAWGEFSIDRNPEGYEESKARALASYGSEIAQNATISLMVPDGVIRQAFEPNEAYARVEAPS